MLKFIGITSYGSVLVAVTAEGEVWTYQLGDPRSTWGLLALEPGKQHIVYQRSLARSRNVAFASERERLDSTIGR
jgi:hypothetical protein